jgi:hypothetical protein
MIKRVRWMGAGLAVGIGSSLWAQRKVKSVMARYTPAGLGGGAVNRVKVLPGEVKAALREGRSAMQDREAELRSDALTRGRRTPGRP